MPGEALNSILLAASRASASVSYVYKMQGLFLKKIFKYIGTFHRQPCLLPTRVPIKNTIPEKNTFSYRLFHYQRFLQSTFKY